MRGSGPPDRKWIPQPSHGFVPFRDRVARTQARCGGTGLVRLAAFALRRLVALCSRTRIAPAKDQCDPGTPRGTPDALGDSSRS